MSHAYVIIIWIMSGGDFHGSCSEIHIYRNRVRYDRQTALEERMEDEFSVKVLSLNGYILPTSTDKGEYLITWIVGMNSNGRVTQHCLRTSGGDNDFLVYYPCSIYQIDKPYPYAPEFSI